MSNRAIVIILAVLGALLWVGMLSFMNQQPPLAANQAVFLLLFSLAVACTAMPLSYVLNARWARSRGARYDLNRVLRQGLLLGLIALILMALRLLQVLTWQTAAVMLLVGVLIEVMMMLRVGR